MFLNDTYDEQNETTENFDNSIVESSFDNQLSLFDDSSDGVCDESSLDDQLSLFDDSSDGVCDESSLDDQLSLLDDSSDEVCDESSLDDQLSLFDDSSDEVCDESSLDNQLSLFDDSSDEVCDESSLDNQLSIFDDSSDEVCDESSLDDQLSLLDDSSDEVCDESSLDDQLSLLDDSSDEVCDESSLDDQLSLFDDSSDESVTDFKDENEESSDSHDEQPSDENDEEHSDIRFTPSEDSSLGSWTGERGNSEFIPDDEEVQRILNICDAHGVAYHDGIIDFSPFSVATVYLTNEEMEQLSDKAQKEMACFSIADAAEDETDVNEELIHAIGQEQLEDPVEDFYSYILEGKTPPDYVWHHGECSKDGYWNYQLVPKTIHALCLHAGGRSHSGTSRQ